MLMQPMQAFTRVAATLGERVKGWERSLKWSPAAVDGGRWLLGCSIAGVDPGDFLASLAPLDVPASVREAVADAWPSANFAYLAVEGVGGDRAEAAGIKLYLEFPVELWTERDRRRVWGEESLWCRGFKWRWADGRTRSTDYRMLPGTTLRQGMDLLGGDISRDEGFAPWGTVLTELAGTKADAPEAIDLLRVLDSTGGAGLDLRLYELSATAALLLERLARQPGAGADWSARLWPHLPAEATRSPLGHLSLGRGVAGEPYATLYWASEPPVDPVR